jgi:hypothetical protein
MVTFTINIPQMLAYIPYMVSMGHGSFCAQQTFGMFGIHSDKFLKMPKLSMCMAESPRSKGGADLVPRTKMMGCGWNHGLLIVVFLVVNGG